MTAPGQDWLDRQMMNLMLINVCSVFNSGSIDMARNRVGRPATKL